MIETLTPYDSVEFLETEADMAEYLAAMAEESGNDPVAMTRALGVVAKARNLSEISRSSGLSRTGLYKAFSGEGNPSFVTVAKLADALGLKLSFVAK
jgi:probable addiction module antidote protein